MKRLIAFVLGLAALAFPGSALAHAGGAVYTLTNGASGSRVVVFDRGAGGGLHAVHSFATGGHGTGANLGSEGAVALSPDGAGCTPSTPAATRCRCSARRAPGCSGRR